MIQDSIIKEIQFTESVLKDLERCKDNQGVFNREAMCHISSLRDIAREYLYTLYRSDAGKAHLAHRLLGEAMIEAVLKVNGMVEL